MNYKIWYKRFLENMLERYQALEKSVSILIQGPLHERMRESIPLYLDIVKNHQHFQPKLKNNPYSKDSFLGNLVISYWDNDDESIINDYKSNQDIFLLKNSQKEVNEHLYKKTGRGSAPWVYQNHSSYYGTKSCTGHLCIKVRSDEFYPSLESFYVDIKNENEKPGEVGKYTTCDIFLEKILLKNFTRLTILLEGQLIYLNQVSRLLFIGVNKRYPNTLSFQNN